MSRIRGFLSTLLLVGCGTPAPPQPLPIGTNVQKIIGGVTFTISRTSETHGDMSACNGNNNAVKILVERVDTAGVAMDKTRLGGGDSYTAHDIPLQSGASFRIEVKIWKDGLDLVTCPFTDESCFRAIAVDYFVIQ